MASVITEAAEQLWADGACVVRGVLDEPALERIRAAIDALATSPELVDLGAMAGDRSPARFRAGVDHWRTRPEFVEFATTGPIPVVTAAVLGTHRLWLYEDSVLVKEPGSPVPTRWHTDDGYFHAEGRQMATVWVALDPSPRSAGALRFVRGSHFDDRRYRPTLFVTDEPLPGTEGELVPDLDLDDPAVFGWDLEPGTSRSITSAPCTRRAATSGPRRGARCRCGTAATTRWCG